MRNRTIRLIILFGSLVIVGLIATQIFWVKNAIQINKGQFEHNVNMALMKVVYQIMRFEGDTTHLLEPIQQVSDDFYVVTISNKVYPNLLESLLKKQFEVHHLDMDFEYGIYDCNSNQVLYGNYVNFDQFKLAFQQNNKNLQSTVFPKLNMDEYYFVVHFPQKQKLLFSQMGYWVGSTLVLLLVVLFFAYALFMIFKQKRLSEIQTDFINNMTHEFKTPLSTISISTDVLLNPNIIQHPERLMSYATIIQDEANRLKNQVERVLQIAKLEKQQMKLKKEEYDIHLIITQSIENLKLTIYNSGGKATTRLNAKSSIMNIDKLHITNIIYNLLDNALKYSKENPEITITTTDVKKGIEIAVEDNGIGIPEETQPYIFDKFYRVPTGNVHDVKGFGLGLNYVKIMMEAHGGWVKLKSELNKGSIFTLFIPNEITKN
jgi:two-component system phosphate regulon sensor histidine kinase PhoR